LLYVKGPPFRSEVNELVIDDEAALLADELTPLIVPD
jgi:hypothetical protein